nr:hypothetical protein [Candidatus Aramenus sulfurataquae]
MADYGFVTGNLLSTSTSTFQVTFSSPQSGVIFISSSPIYVGLAGSFTFPSGATYYYFNNQQKWCISVDLSKYYVGVIVYNGSPPIDVTIQVDGQTLSMSSVMGTGVCGYATGIKMNNGLQIGALTCCSFDNVSTGATILPLGNACTCYGVYSCNGCPTSGSTSSLLCPVAPTKNEAFYVTLPTSIAPTKNEAFYVTLPTSIAPTKNEAFYVTLPTS